MMNNMFGRIDLGISLYLQFVVRAYILCSRGVGAGCNSRGVATSCIPEALPRVEVSWAFSPLECAQGVLGVIKLLLIFWIMVC